MSSNHQAKGPGVAQMLQYSSSGHVLGFTSGGMYAVTGSHALHVDFVSANSVQPQADSPASAASADGKAAALSQVTYADLWPGITLTYTATPDSIYTTTYSLAAGANPQDIRLHYNAPLTLDADGNLGIAFETGALTESAPIAWQEIDGKRVSVDSSFRVRGQEVTFSLGKYDPRHALTIDPTLTWNTFLGGTAADEGHGIAVDGSGNVYVTGYSGATWGKPVRAYTSGNDAFAAKLDPSGALTWNTFLGTDGDDVGQGIAVDGSGNVYVAGYSAATWGDPVRAYTLPGNDAFAAKLDLEGNLLWNAFLGGSADDWGFAMAVDGGGNAYVSGNSTATWGSPVRAYTSGYDAFVAKLDSSGGLTWNTFLGGSAADDGLGIAVDYKGNVYVAGDSYDTWGSPVRAYTSSFDAFAAKLNKSGGLIWNTFLGAALNDEGSSITVDDTGHVYVAGWSFDTWGSPLRAYTSGADAFAAKLDSSGALTWNTFLGGTGTDWGYGIALDGSGDVYVAGGGDASWGSPLRAYTSSADALAAKLDSSGALIGNTFLGGTGFDDGRGLAVDGIGNVYVAGLSTLTWGSPVQPFTSSGSDAFAAKLVFPLTISGNAGVYGATVSYTGGSTLADGNGNYSFTVSPNWSGAVTPSKINFTFTPDHRDYSGLTTDQVNQDYAATFVPPPPIIGVFPTDGGQACLLPQVGVELLLTDLMRKDGSFDPSAVTLTLDGTNFTPWAAILQTETSPASVASVLYAPPSDLALGAHQAVFSYPGASGPASLVWNFTVASILCPTGGAHSPALDSGPASDFSGNDSP